MKALPDYSLKSPITDEFRLYFWSQIKPAQVRYQKYIIEKKKIIHNLKID